MKTLVLTNQKGGVGKSLVATQLAFYFAENGQRVLVVDLDHQGNCSDTLRRSGRVAVAGFGAGQLLLGKATPLPTEPFVVVPADADLHDLESRPDEHNMFVTRLRRYLLSARTDFDVCIIDTNPNPDIRYVAALVVARYVLIPIDLNLEAVSGLAAMFTHPKHGLLRITSLFNEQMEVLGVVPNMVEATVFQRASLLQLVGRHANLLLPLPGPTTSYALIPLRTALAEAQAAGVPVWRLRQEPRAAGADSSVEIGPVRSSARDTWRQIRPVFEEVARRMGLEP
jgi:chromosome partitioning protein